MRSLGSRALGALVVSSLFVVFACGSEVADDDGSSSGASSSGGSSSGFSASSSSGETPPPCVGLQCKQKACAGGGTTSLTGKVYLPEGTVPLYNAIVYVPNAPLAPFKPGVTCDQCGTAPSGSPITTALTDATGSFTLKNVPVGVDVPLVIQIGRWRRQVTIPAGDVKECSNADLPQAATRLPRNKAEGDIPQIAITTGDADSLECFLRKLGIDDAEITNPGGSGRVHMFKGDGVEIDKSTPAATTLWNSEAELKKYDMVVLSCEGEENNDTKSDTARAALRNYLDAGGRVFASHFHYTWYKNPTGTNPYRATATWVNNANASPQSQNVTIDRSFAKGQAFSDWMDTVKGTTAPKSGLVPMNELRRNVQAVDDTMSRRWLYGTDTRDPGAPHTKFYTFNTPLGTPPEKQCGRAVYTDIHVSSGDDSNGTFPNNCKTTGFTEQEKALLFLLMDLAACIQDDDKPPMPPPSDGPK